MVGPGFRAAAETPFWVDPSDCAEWKLNLPRAGTFRVRMTWGSDPGTGGPFELTVGDQTLRGKTQSTGSFWNFDRMDVGTIALPAGGATIKLRPDGPSAIALMNLGRLEFVPLE